MVTRLQNECTAATERYIETVRDGCTLMTGCKEIPISEEEEEIVLAHRRKEMSHYRAYLAAQRKLWQVLRKAPGGELHARSARAQEAK